MDFLWGEGDCLVFLMLQGETGLSVERGGALLGVVGSKGPKPCHFPSAKASSVTGTSLNPPSVGSVPRFSLVLTCHGRAVPAQGGTSVLFSELSAPRVPKSARDGTAAPKERPQCPSHSRWLSCPDQHHHILPGQGWDPPVPSSPQSCWAGQGQLSSGDFGSAHTEP